MHLLQLPLEDEGLQRPLEDKGLHQNWEEVFRCDLCSCLGSTMSSTSFGFLTPTFCKHSWVFCHHHHVPKPHRWMPMPSFYKYRKSLGSLPETSFFLRQKMEFCAVFEEEHLTRTEMSVAAMEMGRSSQEVSPCYQGQDGGNGITRLSYSANPKVRKGSVNTGCSRYVSCRKDLR